MSRPLLCRYGLGAVLAGVVAAAAAAERAPINGVLDLRASAVASGVRIEWLTEGAANLVAFQVQRAPGSAGPWTALHAGWLTTPPEQPTGYALKYQDTAAPGAGDFYRLTARDARGATRDYGPVAVTPGAGAPMPQGQTPFSVQPRVQPTPMPAPLAAPSAPEALLRVAADEPAPSKLKIKVRDTGLYFLSVQDIAAVMGWATNDVTTLLAQRQVRLSSRGRKTAYVPAPADSGLYFFNQSQPDLYEGDDVYWLERGHGLVLPAVDGAVPPDYVPTVGTFSETLHFETNINMVTSGNVDPETDYWYGTAMLAGPTASNSFPARAPSVATGPARLTVRMLGITTTGYTNEHHAILSMNGTVVGSMVWGGLTVNTGSFDIPDGVFTNGMNEVGIQRPLDPGIPYSFVILDWFDIQYNRHNETEGDRLLCKGLAPGPVTLAGLSTDDVLVWDVSDPSLPRPLSGVQVQPTNSAFTVSFAAKGTNAAYFICTRTAVCPASDLTAHALTGLRSASNRADYLAFSVPSLTNELTRLIAHRQAGGWTPKVVLTEQLYDDFNHGRQSPHAMKRCLAYARAQWLLPPTHTLLVGAGSFDYRNYKGLDGCQVPTLLVATPDGLFGADNQLADVQDNDGVPDLAIGRLPTATPAALSNIIDKIVAHDTAVSGVWQSNVVFAADNPDEGGNFTASSEAVASLLPVWITQQKAYLETQSVSAVRTTIRTGLNAGVVWMNYFGHAGWSGLAQEQILAPADISSLTNRTTPCVLTAMTCLINRFEVPGAECFSERLLLEAPGGVAAVWSATGLSINSAAEALDRAFYQHRYQTDVGTLGEGARRALQSGHAQGIARFELDIMTLLGDPALLLR